MLVKILIILAVIIIGILVYAATKPGAFRVSRTMTMNAAPDRIFPYLNNPKMAEAWSPWLKMDPEAATSTEGPAEGVGATYKWNGRKIGSGIMTIMESVPNQLVRTRLEFLKPMQATNTGEYTLTPQGGQILVTWSMYGQNTYMGKLMGIFLNCDKMVGQSFEDGLASLKALAEK